MPLILSISVAVREFPKILSLFQHVCLKQRSLLGSKNHNDPIRTFIEIYPVLPLLGNFRKYFTFSTFCQKLFFF